MIFREHDIYLAACFLLFYIGLVIWAKELLSNINLVIFVVIYFTLGIFMAFTSGYAIGKREVKE